MNPVSRATVDAAIAKLGIKSSLIKKDSLDGVLSALEVDGADRLEISNGGAGSHIYGALQSKGEI